MGGSEFQRKLPGRGLSQAATVRANVMEIILSQRAAEHIQSQGGRAAVDLLQHSS